MAFEVLQLRRIKSDILIYKWVDNAGRSTYEAENQAGTTLVIPLVNTYQYHTCSLNKINRPALLHQHLVNYRHLEVPLISGAVALRQRILHAPNVLNYVHI